MKKISYLLIIFGIPCLFLVFTVSACLDSPRSLGSDTSKPIDSKFDSTDGIFVFRNTGNWNKDDKIRIYDEIGTVWYEADFTKANFQYLKDAGPNKIRPFAIERGDFSPEFRCIRVSSDWFEVIVDEMASPKTSKYMRRNDSLFKFKTWAEYFTGVGIAFDYLHTDIHISPDGEVLQIRPIGDVKFRGDALKGDWLKVTWSSHANSSIDETSKNENDGTGWIRWRDGDRVMVSLAWD